MPVITITAQNYITEVEKSDHPVLLDFWASWCGPCRMLSPVVEEIADERSDIKVGKINVDDQPELVERFDVRSIPTLMVLEDGVIKNTSAGVVSKESILEMFNNEAEQTPSLAE